MRAVLSLGSNVGRRERSVLAAARAVAALDGVRSARMSSLYETEPVGTGYSRPFVNAVMIIETSLDAGGLLRECRAIEERGGRRPRAGDRTIDIDIILYGDEQSSRPRLVLPHPRFRERLFVLVPLAELDPSMPLPPDGIPAAEAAGALRGGPRVGRISSRAVIHAGSPDAGS